MQALDAPANERAGRGHGDTGRLARHRQQAAVGNRRESLIDIADDRSHWRKILRLGAGGEWKESRSPRGAFAPGLRQASLRNRPHQAWPGGPYALRASNSLVVRAWHALVPPALTAV